LREALNSRAQNSVISSVTITDCVIGESNLWHPSSQVS